jgi:flagellar assembly factor FliW
VPTVLVRSDHLGDLDVDDGSVVEVIDGILGFPAATRYAIVPADESGVYVWLQSVDDPSLSFLALVPAPFFPDYAPELDEADQLALGIESEEDAQILCLVTISDDGVTANLLGPVILHVRDRVARQVVLADNDLSTRAPVAAPG